MLKKDLKVAIVHDFLIQYGGAERVLEVIAEIFPEAPIYTLLYDQEKMGDKFAKKEIRTSYLQKFPKFLRKRYQWLLPSFVVVPETFDLRDFDLVISSTGAWSKGIITRLNTVHISYLHSPMRFVWELSHGYIRGFFSRLLLSYVRMWDKLASERPDYLIANSRYTQERIKKYYRRESLVIYPPAYNSVILNEMKNPSVSNTGFNLNCSGSFVAATQDDKFFLIVSRLSPYKKVDLAVEAFNKLGLPLVIIGEGKQKKYLEKIAKNNIKILGWASDKKLSEYYSNARAFIFPSDDDFGMTMVEAMSYDVPVIAYRKGGALEIVEEGKTGEFFDAQTPEVLADGVRRFIEKENSYDKADIINRAKEFSKERFKRKLGEFINKVL
ncbi:MAG: glycosyltransferase [Parcubacteria group bacterium]|jgi:glycosyltransferase involved in cell wall biosynthesis